MDQAQRVGELAEQLRRELEELAVALTTLQAELCVLRAESRQARCHDELRHLRDLVARDMLRLSTGVSLQVATFRAQGIAGSG